MTIAVKQNSRVIVVPKALLRQAGFKPGVKLKLENYDGKWVIETFYVRDELTPRQQKILDKGLAEGLADIEAGRAIGPFATHKEFIDSLHDAAEKINSRRRKKSGR